MIHAIVAAVTLSLLCAMSLVRAIYRASEWGKHEEDRTQMYATGTAALMLALAATALIAIAYQISETM